MRILTTFFMLMLSVSSIAPPVVGDLGSDLDKKMITLYPDWWAKDPSSRETITMMFNTSRDKHAWFPDLYPEIGSSFTIQPSSHILKTSKQ